MRPSKKKCYDDIGLTPEVEFKGVYDAKHAYCKWEIKNVPYEQWDKCNDKWGVKYDEEDCSYKFLNLNWTMA